MAPPSPPQLDRSAALPRGVLYGILMGLFILAGCSSFSNEEPPVSDSTFTRVLTEIHLMEARSNREPPLPPGIRDSILARYDLQPEEYKATLEHYSRHPQAFENLYQGVIDSLQATRNRLREAPQTVPDSLRRPNSNTP